MNRLIKLLLSFFLFFCLFNISGCGVESSTHMQSDNVTKILLTPMKKEERSIKTNKKDDATNNEESEIEEFSHKVVHDTTKETYEKNIEKSPAIENDKETLSNTRETSDPKQTKDPKNKTNRSHADTNKPSSQVENKQQETDKSIDEADKAIGTITISIVISENEIPLSATEIHINEGETVFDTLVQITKEKGIHLDYTGSGSTTYIRGIANVSERDRGAGSGWLYRVNGEFLHYSAGAVSVQPGDCVEWLYTTNLGKDIGK